ncbi:hypothetical protein NLU13_2919 [Sarocladium strictum]|uniref:Enoyl reductase (ER) domain-containing protein n=1 Tax=Sarocladium strictum TaxID=5046 RepID=A0AA39L9Y7_SARSR|nr:hypothetical protein NLU13_2919 [Sarocladium strictum]
MESVDHLPLSYKAAVYDKPGDLSIKITEKTMPVPGPGEALVKLSVARTGTSQKDVSFGGHEGAGTIAHFGPGADAYGFKVGDPVGIKWLRDICGSCVYCLAGEDGLCGKQSVSGLFQPGTFQQYVTVPARYLTPLPAGLDPAMAAPMLCAGLTSYGALRKANTKPGNWLVVSGAGGGLGHLVTQIASRAFGQRVIGIDQASKESIVKESGAEFFLDVTKGGGDMVAKVKELTGLGAHTVIVCAASNAAFGQGLELLRPGGTLVGVGLPDGDPLKLLGSVLGNRQDAIDVLDLAARGIVTLHYQVRGLGDLQQVFEEMDNGTIVGRVVLDLDR